MVDAGIIDGRERFELIGGEVVPMSPKGVPHETVKMELSRFWSKAVPPEVNVLTETTLYTSEHDFLEPDFIFWPRAVPLKDLRPADILLLVEVADTSLAYDLGRKAGLYAALGIADYWAIDVRTLVTHIHRSSGPDGYADRVLAPHTDRLVPERLPGLAVSLAKIGLTPITGG